MSRRPTSGPSERRELRGLILSGADSRDDRIIRLLGEDDMLVPAIARFARKSSKTGSLSSRLQPLSLVVVDVTSRGEDDLATIGASFVERPFSVIKSDLLRTALASCMAEVVLHILPEYAQEDGLYALLMKALLHLDDTRSTPRRELFLLFLLRILDMQGVLPPLDELPELTAHARAALEEWRSGRFVPLPEGDLHTTARFLEEALSELSGRPLLSGSLLDAALA